MRQLLVKSALVAPLVMGIAFVCAGSTETDDQLPGRAVDSTEAGAVLGTACFYLKSITCSGCTGSKSYSGLNYHHEYNNTGCSAGCWTTKYGTACSEGEE